MQFGIRFFPIYHRDQQRRIIVQAKTNLVDEGKAAAFRLTWARGSVRVEWEEDWVTMTADEVLTGAPKPTKTDNAEELLANVLADGPQKQTAVEAQAKANGISPRTLRRARDHMKIRSTKANGVWWLSLPASRRKSR